MRKPMPLNFHPMRLQLKTFCCGTALVFFALWMSASHAVLQDEIQVYDDEINALGATDLIKVIGAPATANLDGALNIIVDVGHYNAGVAGRSGNRGP